MSAGFSIIHKFVSVIQYMKKAFLYKPENHKSLTNYVFGPQNTFFTISKSLVHKHMINKLIILFFSFLLLGTSDYYGQGCPNNPVAICPGPVNMPFVGGTGLAPGLNVSNPTFNPPAGPNVGCQFNNAVNPQWFLLQATTAGTLGFVLGQALFPNAQNGLLHWSLYPYNAATTCNDINADILPPVACNYNCNTGGGTGLGPIPIGGNPCNFMPSTITAVPGQQFLLLVSNVNFTNTLVSFRNNGTAHLACSPFSVSDATACPGQATTVAASWPGYTNMSYTIIPAAPGANTIQTSPIFTVSSTATTVYTVNATGDNGSGFSTNATQFFTLTINPTATIAVAHATDYCYGSNATLVITPAASSVTALGPIVAPIYTPATSNSSTLVLTNVTSPNANGQYLITATLTSGCIGTETLQLNVAPNFFIAMQNLGVNVCQGANANLNANLQTAPVNSYTWNGPCLTNVVGQNVSIPGAQPNCAGIYTVDSYIVYNTIQCPRTGTVQVNVVATNPVTVTPSYTLCEGLPIVLTATANGSGNYSWIGPSPLVPIGAPSFTSILPNPTIQNPGAGQYVVTANFSNGQLTCSRTATTVVTIVNTYPVSALVPTTICQYATANMFISAAGAPSSYSWTGPCNFTATTAGAVIPNIQLCAIGQYTAMAVWTSGTVECKREGYASITVVPVESITVSNPAPVCRPENVGLLANGLGASSYFWSGPNSFTASIPNPVIYYAPLNATGVYTVTVTYNTGGLTCYNTATVGVSVNPVLSYTLPGYLRGCVGQSMEVTGPVGATSYTWSSSSGLAIDAPNAKDLTFNSLKEPHSGVYTLAASLGPCITSKQVEINVLTAITFTNPPSNYNECRGESKLMTVGVNGGSENYAITWYPNTYMDTNIGAAVTATPFGTTTFNIKAHDLACPSYTIMHSFTYNVRTAPQPNLVLEKIEGCEPFCILLNPGTPKGSGIITYDFGGIKKLQTSDSTLYCGLTDPGSYTLTITSKGNEDNNCTELFTIPTPIVVHPKSRSEITWTPEAPSTTENYVTYSSYSKVNAGIDSVVWYFGGTGINGEDRATERNPQRRYEEIGKYPVMLITTTEFGCVDTVVKFLDIKDDMNLFIPNTFSPNNDGVNDIFQVKGFGFKPEGFVLEIFDRWGHVIFTSRDVTKGWDGSVKGGSPTEGVYIYKIRAIGTNGEGRREYMGHVSLIK